jgi:hypothetical protein
MTIKLKSDAELAGALLPFHPFASVLPMMDGDEFKEFVADIEKTNGPIEPIVMYQGKVLDGRNRYRAGVQLKIEPRFVEFEGDDAAARAFVFSKNICRRHLKPADKRKAIAGLIKAMPEKSDREIGRMAGVSKNTAAAVRSEMEGRGQIDHVEKRKDTKGRKQPARKRPASKPKPAPAPATNPIIPAAEIPAPQPVASEVAKQKVEQKVEPVKVAEAPPPQQSVEPVTNPIARAWKKATAREREEFLISFHIDILHEQHRIGNVAGRAEQRRLDEQRAKNRQGNVAQKSAIESGAPEATTVPTESPANTSTIDARAVAPIAAAKGVQEPIPYFLRRGRVPS